MNKGLVPLSDTIEGVGRARDSIAHDSLFVGNLWNDEKSSIGQDQTVGAIKLIEVSACKVGGGSDTKNGLAFVFAIVAEKNVRRQSIRIESKEQRRFLDGGRVIEARGVGGRSQRRQMNRSRENFSECCCNVTWRVLGSEAFEHIGKVGCREIRRSRRLGGSGRSSRRESRERCPVKVVDGARRVEVDMIKSNADCDEVDVLVAGILHG